MRGFAQHIKNMGKASDMDVCNYFIHNHKVGSSVQSCSLMSKENRYCYVLE